MDNIRNLYKVKKYRLLYLVLKLQVLIGYYEGDNLTYPIDYTPLPFTELLDQLCALYNPDGCYEQVITLNLKFNRQ